MSHLECHPKCERELCPTWLQFSRRCLMPIQGIRFDSVGFIFKCLLQKHNLSSRMAHQNVCCPTVGGNILSFRLPPTTRWILHWTHVFFSENVWEHPNFGLENHVSLKNGQNWGYISLFSYFSSTASLAWPPPWGDFNTWPALIASNSFLVDDGRVVAVFPKKILLKF